MNSLKRACLYLNRIIKRRCQRVFLTLKGCCFGCHVTTAESSFGKGVRCADFSFIKSSEIGAFSSVGRRATVVSSKIGKFCAISWDSTIGATEHKPSSVTISAFPYVPYMGNFVKDRKQKKQVTVIGNDVWVGCNSVVLPGITVGSGAVIGAGSVVTKNVPDYAIVAGVPAKLIRYRFEEGIIKRLLAVQWWNWPKEVIQQNVHLFQGDLDDTKLKLLEDVYQELAFL